MTAVQSIEGRGIEQRLAEGAVLGAEGYVFELERRGYIKAGPYVPEVVLDFPGAVLELHREFLRAGADVMVALTYYAHREKLRHIGRENDLEAMNRSAVRLARSNVSRRSRSWSTSGVNDRRIRCNGDGWNRRGGWMPRTFTCSLNPA